MRPQPPAAEPSGGASREIEADCQRVLWMLDAILMRESDRWRIADLRQVQQFSFVQTKLSPPA